MEAPVPLDEPARLGSLYATQLLDAGANEHFDRVTRIAAGMFGVPMSLVSLVDSDRQWFGSRWGLDAFETPRCDAFCAHTILDREVFVVQNALLDERFADNPLVTGAPHIRFYAGAPISSHDGHRLGTLCIIDTEPRTLDDGQVAALRDLADMIERELVVIGMALTDQLTGLGNRRALIQAGAGLLALAICHNQPMSVLSVNLDYLDQVSARYGQEAGDDLVRRSATVLRRAARSSDVVARTGADEFAVLMYGSNRDTAESFRHRLAVAVDGHNATTPDKPLLSLSTGTATAVASESIEQLVKRAGAALRTSERGPRQATEAARPGEKVTPSGYATPDRP